MTAPAPYSAELEALASSVAAERKAKRIAAAQQARIDFEEYQEQGGEMYSCVEEWNDSI